MEYGVLIEPTIPNVAAYTVSEFLVRNRISRGLFYKLLKQTPGRASPSSTARAEQIIIRKRPAGRFFNVKTRQWQVGGFFVCHWPWRSLERRTIQCIFRSEAIERSNTATHDRGLLADLRPCGQHRGPCCRLNTTRICREEPRSVVPGGKLQIGGGSSWAHDSRPTSAPVAASGCRDRQYPAAA